MLMLHFHSTMGLLLLALIAALGLFIWSLRQQGAGVSLGKISGFILIVVVLLNIICTGNYGYKLWKQGYLTQMPMKMMMHDQMAPPKQ